PSERERDDMAATNFAFLHGGGQGSWVWDETIAALKAQAGAGGNCLRPDAPGCGTQRGRRTAADQVRRNGPRVKPDVEAAGMSDVVLVGHSQAGMELPQMAEYAPQLFSRLIYVTCSAPPPGMTTIERMGDCVHGERDDQVGWPVDPATTTMEERFRAM